MFTVAIIGPDGAGKSTLIEGLQRNSIFPVRRIYMGVNPDSLSHMLPTTRLVNYIKRRRKVEARPSIEKQSVPSPEKSQRRRSGRANPVLRSVKSFLFIVNRFGEAWYRQAVCWYYLGRGYIVLFDRHFYLDQLAFTFAHPDADRPFLRRVYDRMLEKTYPRPDLTIYLDAPPEVLFARKKESTIENLRQMREAYLNIEKYTPAFRVVDTVQPPETVLEVVLGYIKAHKEAIR
jgi:thymidylate kinase